METDMLAHKPVSASDPSYPPILLPFYPPPTLLLNSQPDHNIINNRYASTPCETDKPGETDEPIQNSKTIKPSKTSEQIDISRLLSLPFVLVCCQLSWVIN